MNYQQLTEYAHSGNFWILVGAAFTLGVLVCVIAGIGIVIVRAHRSVGLLMELESLDRVTGEMPDQFPFDLINLGTYVDRFHLHLVKYVREEECVVRLVFTDGSRHPNYRDSEYKVIRTSHAGGHAGISVVPRKPLE